MDHKKDFRPKSKILVSKISDIKEEVQQIDFNHACSMVKYYNNPRVI